MDYWQSLCIQSHLLGSHLDYCGSCYCHHALQVFLDLQLGRVGLERWREEQVHQGVLRGDEGEEILSGVLVGDSDMSRYH